MATTPAERAGQNVRAEMARKAITQAQLGTELGMSQTAVSARLRGLIPFDVNDLTTTAEFLDVTVADLLPTEVTETRERVKASVS